jgi:small Trp-rich protein
MWLLWLGVVFLALKGFGVEPVAQWSWWWVLAPLAGAFVWFEGLEKLFGRDKRQADHAEWEARKKKRVEDQFAQFKRGSAAKAGSKSR